MLKKRILILFLITIGIAGFVYCQDIKEKVEEHYEIGNFYYQQGRYKEANEEFQKALDLFSQEEISEKEVVPPEKKELVTVKKESTIIEYIIGVGDELHISVWQNPDLDQEVIVRPDGKISFPLVDDIQASGLSITQLDEEITEGLKEYIKFPEVSISIKKLGGKKVVVLGQVKSPGVYSVTGERTILEAIGLAGGFTPHAVASSVVLIRGGFQETPRAERINLTKAINSGNLPQDITLESEDVVFVPKKFIANLNYFLSQVLDPIIKGSYRSEKITTW